MTHQIRGVRGLLDVELWSADEPTYAVLLVHGYGEHAGRYAHVAERFVEDGALVVAPDHQGHGRSEGERALVVDAEELVDDLARVADQLVPEGLPVLVFGHSMGGIVATRYVQRAAGRVDALALTGPVIGGNPGFVMLASLDPIPEIPIDPASLSRDPAVGEAYLADPLVHHGGFRRETLEAMIAAVDTIAKGPGFGDLPVLWLHGELDELAPYDLTAAAFAPLRGTATEARVYPGAKHELVNETNRDEVIDALLAFADKSLTR